MSEAKEGLVPFLTTQNEPHKLIPWFGEVAKVGMDEALVRSLLELGFRATWATDQQAWIKWHRLMEGRV